MGELKNPKLAIPVVLMAGIFWSFGPYVVRHIDEAHTVPWQYLFARGMVIFILLNSKSNHSCPCREVSHFWPNCRI